MGDGAIGAELAWGRAARLQPVINDTLSIEPHSWHTELAQSRAAQLYTSSYKRCLWQLTAVLHVQCNYSRTRAALPALCRTAISSLVLCMHFRPLTFCNVLP
eukprot:1161840-Pelagomonas_calceolata.AAC.5